MKKILYIEHLDYISLIFGIILKPFYKEVIFHNAIKSFRSKKFIKILNMIGIGWLNYFNVPKKVFAKAFSELNHNLSQSVMDKRLKKLPIYKDFIKIYKINNKGENKIETMFKASLIKYTALEGTPSFSLIEHYYDKSIKITYMPRKFVNYTLAKELKNNIRPIRLHFIFFDLFLFIKLLIKNLFNESSRFIKKIINFQFIKINNQAINIKNYSKYKFAFFPHKGLKYGTQKGGLFKKTYFYENNSNSFFYKKKILSLSFEPFDDLSKRYFKINKIPHDTFNINYISLFFEILKVSMKLNKYKLLKSILSLDNFYEFWFLILHFGYIIYYKKFLNKYPTLKIIYFHYDMLVPRPFIVSCHLNKIETISAQERPSNYIWCPFLIYDHYFIMGPGFENEINNSSHCIDNFYVSGPSRSSYIVNIKTNNQYERFNNIKKKYTLVLGFDSPLFLGGESNRSYYWENALQPDRDQNAQIQFYLAFLSLAKEFKKHYFLIKPKDIIPSPGELLHREKFYEIIEKSKKLDNFEILTDLNKYKPYNMVSLSNIVIGQYTSILEEAFSVDKKVFIFDLGHFIISKNHVLNDVGIVVDNYQDLRTKFKNFVDNDKYLEPKIFQNFKSKFYLNDNKYSGFQIIKNNIEKIYNNSI